MPRIVWRHYAYIAHFRGLPSGSKTCGEIKEKIGVISDDEHTSIKYWDDMANKIPSDIYGEYNTPSELSLYLQQKTKFQCPIGPIPDIFKGSDGKRQLLAFYIIKGHNVWYPKPIFTVEQRSVIDYDEGCVVVNAGPGTGKTTTAIERAYQKKDEGVLIMSYSVETASIIKDRAKEYPGRRGVIGFKEFNKAPTKTGQIEPYKIVITTLDSLAWFIAGKGSITESDSTHAQAVDDAISAVKYRNCPMAIKHIIIDEAQDIDENRGTLIKALYATGLFKSITIFGDPRQKIMANAGKWYYDLWVLGSYKCGVYLKKKIDIPTYSAKSKSLLESLGQIKTISNSSSFVPFKMAKQQVNPLYEEIETSVECVKVGLTITHRFKNKLLLDLHNLLSSRRPEIHVELTPPPSVDPNIGNSELPMLGKIRCFDVGHFQDESKLVSFAQFLKKQYIDSKFCGLSDIAVIIPSISADNQTSKRAQMLSAVFRDEGLPSYTRKEGSFNPNAILISTIPSIKGKQYKIIIQYCMSDYPKNFPQVPYEEAESQIFVAHTRAELEIIYLCNDRFVPPRGIPLEYIETYGLPISASSRSELKLEARPFGVTDMIGSHGWSKLLNTNCYSINAELKDEVFPKVPTKPEVVDERLYGILCGLVVESFLNGRHSDFILNIVNGKTVQVSNEDYVSFTRNGIIFQGLWTVQDDKYGYVVYRKDGVNAVRKEELDKLAIAVSKPLNELNWSDWFLLTQFYDFIIGGHMASRYIFGDISNEQFPLLDFKNICINLITKFGPFQSSEGYVRYSWAMGAYDLLFENAIVELKVCRAILPSHRQQVLIYNAALEKPKSHVYVYNMNDGNVETITSPQHLTLWRYLIDAYGTIKNHIDLVTSRRNRLIEQGHKLPVAPTGLYVADTEFHEGKIFDYAMVNLQDPYCSIVQTLYSTDKFAVKWLSDHHKLWDPVQLRILLSNSRSNLDELFMSLGKIVGHYVMYYIAKEDVELSNKFGMKSLDIASILSKLASTRGASCESQVRVKLGEIYDLVSGVPMEFQLHLNQHSALTDALLLYELYHCGYLL
jgi:phospholipid N-methyltransferase